MLSLVVPALIVLGCFAFVAIYFNALTYSIQHPRTELAESPSISSNSFIQTQSKLEEDAKEFGTHLARELWEDRISPKMEDRYTREVTGANMYGYHKQSEIDSFASLSDNQCRKTFAIYWAKFEALRNSHAQCYLKQQGLNSISEGNLNQKVVYAEIKAYEPYKLNVSTVAALEKAKLESPDEIRAER
jgi:hypothetical protein